MNFNEHSRLEGQHAFLSASNYHWINYDEAKLADRFTKFQAAQRGSELHDIAAQLIRFGLKQPKTNKTFNMYVNDAIGFKMEPERVLYYSDNCFGTADAISFRNMFLRIHDLKNGETPASIKQLMVYDALFCLEYNMKPTDIEHELRLYQSNEVLVHKPEPDEIFYIMDKIISFMKVESSDDLSNFLNESLIIRTFLWDLKNGHVSSLKSPKNEYIKRIRIRPNLAHIFEPNLQRSLLRTMWFLCESIVLYNENLLNISNKQLLDDKDKERLIIVKPYIKALEILINEKNDQHFGHYVTVGKFYELENEYDRSLQYYEKALYIIENEDPNVDPLDPFWKEKCDIIRRHIGRVKSKKDNKNTLFTPVSKTSSYLNH